MDSQHRQCEVGSPCCMRRICGSLCKFSGNVGEGEISNFRYLSCSKHAVSELADWDIKDRVDLHRKKANPGEMNRASTSRD